MRAKRFEALDGWRGIAALAIAFYHAPIANPLRDMAGWKNWELFVDLFFVLSGFVMMHAWGARLADTASARDFLRRRFWRIWPLHFFVLFAFLVLEVAKFAASSLATLPLDGAPFADNHSWASLISNIVMTQALNLHGQTTWNAPAWSISVEFWTYLVFAGALLVFRSHFGKAAIAIALLGAAVVASFSPIYLFATHDFGFFRCLFGFFVGVTTYRIASAETAILRAGTALEVAAVAAMALFLISTGKNPTTLFAPLVFAGLILVFAHGSGRVTGLLLGRPAQALGQWSYSIYLVHTLLYYLVSIALLMAIKVAKLPMLVIGVGGERTFSTGSAGGDFVMIALLMAATVGLSSLTYRLIEKPFMAKSNPVPSGRSSAASAIA